MIAKTTDILSKASFEEDFAKLIEIVETECEDTPGRERALTWLVDLRSRAPKWCLRFAWSFTTWGIHSTQRAESMQHVVKRHLTKKPHVTELVEDLNHINQSSRDGKKVRDAVLAAKQDKARGSCALVDFLHSNLVPYAFKMVLEQEHVSTTYRVTAISLDDETDLDEEAKSTLRFGSSAREEEQWFKVVMTYAARPMTLPKVNSDGSIDWSSSNGEEDFGTTEPESSTRIHYCTLRWCSCQFMTAFGGLPCRHCIRVHDVSQTEEPEFRPLLERIESKWILISQSECNKLEAKLRAQPDPTTKLPSAPRVRMCQSMSRTERYKALVCEFDALSDLGCKSDLLFDLALAGMKKLTLELIDPKPSRSCRPETANTTFDNEANELDDHDKVQADTQLGKSGSDEASLKKVLGFQRQTRAPPLISDYNDDQWWRSLLDGEIVIKFNYKRRGGWALGIIVGVGIDGEEVVESMQYTIGDDEAGGGGDGDEQGEEEEGEQEEEEEEEEQEEEEEGEAEEEEAEEEEEEGEEEEEEDPEEEGENEGDENLEEYEVAEVSQRALAMGEVKIAWPNEDPPTWSIVQLKPKNYAEGAYASREAWMLVEARPLGISSGARVHVPKSKVKGRPTTKRRAPSAGPMAQSPRRRKSMRAT